MLYEYVREAQNFFPKGSNTILLFLAGEHSINTTLIINSTTSHLLRETPSQALVRSSGSRINCSNEAKIVFNVRNASITGLDFYSCGIDVTGSEGLSANLVLGDVTFDNSYNRQYASGVIHGMYCSLDVEADAVVDFNGRGGKSSGLYLTNCNATLSGTIQFHNNIADGGAGLAVFCEANEYCTLTIDGKVSFLNNTANKQCNANRTGLLCGACEGGLSLVLGSSRCMQCSNIYLLHLVMFAVAGFALVVFFLTCKLTVAVGTISGLIFYANTIAVNESIFLPERSTNILTVFLAWVNLDLGIETCFYNGMDAYAKVWLQFVFPFYIWSIIVLVMVISRFSKRISKLLGSNPIAALTTPVLLSYAKILRAIVFAVSSTELEYPGGRQRVWLQDGNVKFLQGRHIALFVSALIVFFVLFLPYTLLLLLGHWLQAKSHLWVLSWISSPRVKFFLDAHYAPYKDEHRYWPGLLLLVQCALFNTAFYTNTNVTLLSIFTATLGIAIWVWNFGSVFKFWYLNALEGSFILNLGILVAGTQYILHTGGNQAALTYMSISVALVTFTGIVVYHVCLQVRGTDLVMQCRERFLKTYTPRQERVERLNESQMTEFSMIGSQRMPRYVDFSQPREPLLEPHSHSGQRYNV